MDDDKKGIKMKRQEYEEYIDLLEKAIDKCNVITKEIKDTLDNLFMFKPVSLKWYVLKCRTLNKMRQYEETLVVSRKMICKESYDRDNVELWKEYIDALKMLGKDIEEKQERYILGKLLNDNVYCRYEEELQKKKNEFVEGNLTPETLMTLEEDLFVCCQRLASFLIYLYRIKLYPDTEDNKALSRYVSMENMAYFYECVQKKVPVIIVWNKEESQNMDIISYLLHQLGILVYFIGEPIFIEGDYSLQDSIKVSIDNIQEYEDCIFIPPITKKENGCIDDTNIPYIIDYICKNRTEKDFAITVSCNHIIEDLRVHKAISKRFERLGGYEVYYLESEIGFGWSGNYYTYISNLYKQEVRVEVERQPEYQFSIVVPVRNATETLYHTLRTCIEQEYDGTYEIVLSDNSEEGNEAAYNVYKKLNNEHIMYYRTPRQLNLIKSFEYAFLKTRGKYIIPIGADDALFPWTLAVLEKVWGTEENKNRNVVVWERGMYVWPGFNGGQENELAIPGFHKKCEVQYHEDKSEKYFKAIKENPHLMYILPNMYINSGFRREYMEVLYEKTGRLWDGYSQDIYMGIQNLVLNSEILRIEYPLAMAGMSSTSVGAVCANNSVKNSLINQQAMEKARGGIGMNAKIKAEKEMSLPTTGSDVNDMYICIYHLMTKGIIPSNYIMPEEEKLLFINCYNSIDKISDKYEKNVKLGRYLAGRRTNEFVKWYEENVAVELYGDLLYRSEEIIKKAKEKKIYREGYTPDGGVILDASRYGVTNIYEAVQLFKSFLNF